MYLCLKHLAQRSMCILVPVCLMVVLVLGRVGHAAVWSPDLSESAASLSTLQTNSSQDGGYQTPQPVWQDWDTSARGGLFKRTLVSWSGGTGDVTRIPPILADFQRMFPLLLCLLGYCVLGLCVNGLMMAAPCRADEPYFRNSMSDNGLPATNSPTSTETEPNAIPATLWEDAGETLMDQPSVAFDTWTHLRHNPDGQLSWKLRIRVDEPHHYPRIPFLDHDDENSIFFTYRANLMGRETPVEWDFYNLIATDRPDFTDATFTVGRGVTYLESGYTFRRTVADDLKIDRRQVPEFLLRFGVTDELELRLRWNGMIMTDITDTANHLTQSSYGGDDLQLGFKYEVIQQDGWVPMVTTVCGMTVPTGTRDFSADQIQPFGNIVLGWGIRRWLYFKHMTGVDTVHAIDAQQIVPGPALQGPIAVNSVDNNATWHDSAALLFQVNKHVGGFVEWFSFFSNNSADNRAAHYYDLGTYIYVTPNVQFDVRWGQRLGNRVDSYFTGAGFSTRW